MPSFKPVDPKVAEQILTAPQVRKGNPPAWAQSLMERVLRDMNPTNPDYKGPELRWYKRQARARDRGDDGTYSTGWCQYNARVIKINAGTNQNDVLCTVLHEIAHWITGGGHTLKFWRNAFYLFTVYGPDTDEWRAHCYRRSCNYKRGASKVAPVGFSRAAHRVYHITNCDCPYRGEHTNATT